MKITKEQLKQIIKEELESLLEGQSDLFSQYGLQGWGDWGAKDGPRMKPKKKKTDPNTGEKKEIEENSRQLSPLERQLMKQEPELFQWYLDQNVDPQFLDIDKGRWYIIYNAIDEGYRSHTLPDGWSADIYAQGGSDEDTNYIITKDSDSDPRSMFDWWEDENL